jgi:centromere protein C
VQGESTTNELRITAPKIFVTSIGVDESMTDDQVVRGLEEFYREEESEVVPEAPKEKAKRGRKRKSDVVEVSEREHEEAENPRKLGPAAAQPLKPQKKSKKNAPADRRRSKRVCDMSGQKMPIDDSLDQSEQVEEVPIMPKRRGRPPKAKPVSEQEDSVVKAPVDDSRDQLEQVEEASAPRKRGRPAKVQPNGDKATSSAPAKPAKSAPTANKSDSEFTKPARPVGRSKANAKPKAKSTSAEPKSNAATKEKTPQADSEESGRLVDVYGNPLSEKDIDQISATSAGSRFGRGRHLSVFREMDPDNLAHMGRTGRHRVAPIDFWKNDHISYNSDGSMSSIVKSQAVEEERRQTKRSNYKSKKRTLAVVEEEEIELDHWEEQGTLVGSFRGFDPVADVASHEIIEDSKSFWM